MSHIWHALLDDPKRSVDQHFAAIAGSLLKEMGANSWRVRESAAAAWGDLLQVGGSGGWVGWLVG